MRFQTETGAVDLHLYRRSASGDVSPDVFPDYNREWEHRLQEGASTCIVSEDELDYIIGYWQMECEHANRGMDSVLAPITPEDNRAGAAWLFVCDEVNP